MTIKRSIQPAIVEAIEKKIILLSGPRQVGKTFLSKNLEKKFQYFNFDLSEDRLILLKKIWVRDESLLIFDEIHKMKKWKQWIKGIYDTEGEKNKYILTGSSRMDTFKKTGDSLAGRNFAVRLLPFSIKELGEAKNQKVLDEMLVLGSFPEPFLSGSEKNARLWRKSHTDIILRQDLIQLESVKDLISIELLVDLLRKRAGQQIVISNLAAELQVSPHTVKKWIQLLESFFIIFCVYPYTKNVANAVKKEFKVYFYDIAQVTAEEGHKIENLVALHLLKRNLFLEDTEGYKLRLCYLRDKQKREIDFVIEQDQKLTHLIEVKSSDSEFNKSLDHFSNKLKPTYSFHLVFRHNRDLDHKNYRQRSVLSFLSGLET